MALPPHWTRYTTEDGKDYFHNEVTNVTQWDKPAWPEPVAPEPSTSEVFQYKPTASELEVQRSPPAAESQGMLDFGGLSLGGNGASLGGGTTIGMGAAESELVSLKAAPSGQIGSGLEGGGVSSGGSSGGGAFDGFGGLAGGVISAAMGGASGGAGQGDAAGGGVLGWVLVRAQQLFDVSTEDVVRRLRLALMPYPLPQPAGSSEEFRARPDFYGPFWVATTAVLFLAATGNFARLVEVQDHTHFKADYGLVSIAASMVYGFLILVPLVVRVSLLVSGEEASSVDFMQMISVCGYGLAPSIPVSILCIIPLHGIRWLVTMLGLAMSLLFLRGHLWVDLAVKAQWLRWVMIATPCASQAMIFLVYRLHFFSGVPM